MGLSISRRHRRRHRCFVALRIAVVMALLSSVSACRKQVPAVAKQVVNATNAHEQSKSSKRNLAVPQFETRKPVVVPPITEWETEKLSEIAGQQLKQLGKQLTAPTPFLSGTLISTPSAANTLFDSNAPTVFRDSAITVRRTAELDDSPDQDLLEQLKSLQQANDWDSSKFKIIRVRRGEEKEFSTQVYCHLGGRNRNDDANVEMNATWDIDWRLSEKGQPQLVGITNRTTEYASRRQSLFHDVTSSVIGNNDVFATCIQPSISTLRERIEHRLGVYNLGHHGVAIGDVNGDDLPDAYVCQTGGLPNHLFIQNADGTATDVANEYQVDYLDNTRAALLIDLDNDSDQDLVVTLSSGMLLLENMGQGQFRERARIRSVKQGFSLSAADYNNDGRLDIYVCVYYGNNSNVSELPVPVPYFDATNGGANHLVINDGDWSFRDATEEARLDQDNSRFSFASAWDDIDSDGDQDLLVVNDFGPNQLFRNTDGKFEDVASEVGLIDGAFGMSASFGDFNRDGRSDIYVANMFSAAGNRIATQDQFKPNLDDEVRKKFLHLARGNSLFLSEGDKFSDVSVASGVTVGRWSWGSVFADVNNDGWEDLLVGNGYVTGKTKDDL